MVEKRKWITHLKLIYSIVARFVAFKDLRAVVAFGRVLGIYLCGNLLNRI